MPQTAKSSQTSAPNCVPRADLMCAVRYHETSEKSSASPCDSGCSSDGSSTPGLATTAAAAAALRPCPSCSSFGNLQGKDAEHCVYYQQERLYHHCEAPPVLQFNRYIRTGYRAGLSYSQCLRSMAQLHNETGNIVTHALPLLWIAIALTCGLVQPWPAAPVEFMFHVACIALCFLGSVCYHTLQAHHHCYHMFLGLDVCGIMLVVVGTGHLVLWWGLHCHPLLRAVFCFVYYATAAHALWSILHADSALKRGLPILALIAIRVVSFVARLYVLPVHGGGVQNFLAMEVLCLLGGVVNAARIPERWFQPKDLWRAAPFDYWLNSHQLMHLLTVAACLQLYLGAGADYEMVQQLSSGALQCPA